MLHYPFADRLFSNSLNAVEYVKQFGTPVILSDGDVVFQPHKIHDSGLYKVFDGAVLIYIHKEVELDDVANRYPADHYVLIDDKLRILSEVKKIWSQRVTTVFVRQGHYAFDEKIISSYPAADVTIEHIGDLVQQDFSTLV
jgi:FMN phosphatase YigB (HAD superfamily)